MLKLKNDTIRNSNTMFFDCDDDFCQFCIDPDAVLTDNGRGFTFNFTPWYQDAVNNGTIFIIRDENSQVFKHGAVSYRTITKPVQNLQQYYKCLYDRD